MLCTVPLRPALQAAGLSTELAAALDSNDFGQVAGLHRRARVLADEQQNAKPARGGAAPPPEGEPRPSVINAADWFTPGSRIVDGRHPAKRDASRSPRAVASPRRQLQMGKRNKTSHLTIGSHGEGKDGASLAELGGVPDFHTQISQIRIGGIGDGLPPSPVWAAATQPPPEAPAVREVRERRQLQSVGDQLARGGRTPACRPPSPCLPSRPCTRSQQQVPGVMRELTRGTSLPRSVPHPALLFCL